MKKLLTSKKYLIVSLCLLFTLSGCSLLDPQVTAAPQVTAPASQPPVPMAEGRLAPRNFAWLSFGYSAKVAEVLVEEGQWVAKGTALASLGDREEIEAHLKAAEQVELEAQEAMDRLEESADLDLAQAWNTLLAAQAALMDAQEMLDLLDTTSYQNKIDRAWEKVQDEKKNLEDAQDEYDKYKNLDEDNYRRRYAEDRLEEAQNRYNQAVREHDRLVNALNQARQLWPRQKRLWMTHCSATMTAKTAPTPTRWRSTKPGWQTLRRSARLPRLL